MNYTAHQIAAMLNEIDPTQVMVGADFEEHEVIAFNKLANRIVQDAAKELQAHITHSDAHTVEDIIFNNGLGAAVNILREIAP